MSSKQTSQSSQMAAGKRTVRRRHAFAAVIAVLTLAMAACSGATDVAGGGSGGGGATEAGQAAAGDDTIRIVQPDSPASVDPCESSRSETGRLLRGNITEALTDLDLGTGELGPSLATEWEETSPTTWEFTLREGVEFHNGEPFNADAVAQWITRIINPEANCYILGNVIDVDAVESASAIDDLTVEIVLTRPDPILPLRFSFVDIGAPMEDPMTKTMEPIGTGPYRFVSWSPGQPLVIERSDTYWGEQPDVAGVEYVFRDESSVRAAMASAGEVDIATAIGPQDADMPGAITYVVTETLYYRIDVGIPPLDDVRVRRAINHAVDRQGLIDAVYAGHGEPAHAIVYPTVSGYNEDVTWEYDPELARELLAEAEADGVAIDTPIEVIGELNARGSNGSELMDTVAAMLTDVGLTATGVGVEEDSVRLNDVPFSPDYAPALMQNVHGNSLGDASTSLVGKLACDAPQSVLCDETLDEMLAEAVALGGEEREQRFQEIFAYLQDEVVPLVPVAHLTDTIVITNDRLKYEPNAGSFEKIRISDMTLEDA